MTSLPVPAALLAAVLVLAGYGGGSGGSDSAGDPPAAASTTPASTEPVKADAWERPAVCTSSDVAKEGWESYEFYDERISFQAPAGWASEQSDLNASVKAPDEAATITILYVTEAKAAPVGVGRRRSTDDGVT